MGPQILLDKSALQALSQDEVWDLHSYYYVVVSPILVVEILGDLKKKKTFEEGKLEVQKLTRKTPGYSSLVTTYYKVLLLCELTGVASFEVDGRPVIAPGEMLRTETGEKVMNLGELPEHEALRHWGDGQFTEAEQALAERWRESTRGLDLQAWKRLNRSFPRCDDLPSVYTTAVQVVRDPGRQLEHLQWLCTMLGFDETLRNAVFNRWLSLGMPPIQTYAPYADFCLTVFTAFYLGLANGRITPKPTNRVDLEYVLYLPFTLVFTSSDAFLAEFAPLFLNERQDFVHGRTLKNDLKQIAAHWQGKTEEECRRYRRRYGTYPPDIPGSFTNEVWGKHCVPREQYKPGKPLEDWTEEEHKAEMARLRPVLDALEKAEKRKHPHSHS